MLAAAPMAAFATPGYTVLYTFTGAGDGGDPQATLLADLKGNLYGTTYVVGEFGKGAVFKLTPGVATEVLYSFKGHGRGLKDGANPNGGVIVDSGGNLYGTTVNGGAFGKGAVFKLAPNGAETVLRSFSGRDGANPLAGLIADAEGNLYGATTEGGA